MGNLKQVEHALLPFMDACPSPSGCSLSMFDTMRFTCTAWRAAVLAAPHLVPVAMLELPAVDAGPQAQAQALRAAAALHPLTWHVVIKGASEKAQVRYEMPRFPCPM